MKRTKTILLNSFFYLTALQILNLSIDVDYATSNLSCCSTVTNYDDIDSYAELIIEKIAGNDNLFSEVDDDSGSSSGKNLEKYNTDIFCLERFSKPQIYYSFNPASSSVTAIDPAEKISKGYIDIISPPPKS